jgi:Ger(x)C family germination protein
MKKLLIILIILSTLMMTGCWDMIEIEDRIYPYSIGIDINNDRNKEGKFLFTVSYPNIAAIGKNATSEDPIFIIDDTANSIFELMHKLTSRLQRPIYLKLLNVVLLSEEVAKDSKSMREIVDSLNRDFIISKNVQMLLVKDNAKELLSTKLESKRQQAIEGSLNSMLNNKQKSSMFIPINFMNFIEATDISDVAIVPLAMPGEEEIIISGGAILKDYSLIGYLEPMEVRVLATMNDEINQDTIDSSYNGADLSVMITGVKSKKKLINEGENLKIKFDIELEGHIHSFILEPNMAIKTGEMLDALQNAVAQEVKVDMDELVKKAQKEYGVDMFKLRNYISKYHPKLWEEIQDNWEVLYPDIEIEVDVKVFLRRRGLSI